MTASGINEMVADAGATSYLGGVYGEWKFAGSISNGTTRAIAYNYFYRHGQPVIASYPIGGLSGHTSPVSGVFLNSWRLWWGGMGYDTYVQSFDFPGQWRNLTANNVAASGIYTMSNTYSAPYATATKLP